MHNATCEHCGGDLEFFEGESYCPDCLYWNAVDEAVAGLNLDHGELPELDERLPW